MGKELDIVARLHAVGAFNKGHYVLTSGLHTDTFVNKDAVFPNTRELSLFCMEMALKFVRDPIEVVIGPAIAAATLASWTAFHLTYQKLGKDVLAAYADKNGKKMVIRRGFDKLITGKNVLIVEDVTSTGGSICKVSEAVTHHGGNVFAGIAIFNRGNVTAQQAKVPYLAHLAKMDIPSWTADECPLCKAGVPVNTDLGHGAKFLEAQKAILEAQKAKDPGE